MPQIQEWLKNESQNETVGKREFRDWLGKTRKMSQKIRWKIEELEVEVEKL